MIAWITGALATWRIASLLVHEDGPFDVFGQLRDAAGITFDERGHAEADNEIGRALLCIWCASVWVGWGIALLMDRHQWLLKGLAFSAISILFERRIHGSR